MIYKKLINYALSRHFLTHSSIKIENALSEQEIQFVEKMLEEKPITQSLIGIGDGENNLEIRSSKVFFINYSKENSWLFEKINLVVEKINEEYYNYDLNGYDFLQYSEYSAEEIGHYDYHIDMSFDAIPQKDYDYMCRKLSFSIALNDQEKDYMGGDFEIKTGVEAIPVKLNRGDLLLFPSFILHRVTPVTKGIRKSLVGWVLGPKFK